VRCSMIRRKCFGKELQPMFVRSSIPAAPAQANFTSDRTIDRSFQSPRCSNRPPADTLVKEHPLFCQSHPDVTLV